MMAKVISVDEDEYSDGEGEGEEEGEEEEEEEEEEEGDGEGEALIDLHSNEASTSGSTATYIRPCMATALEACIRPNACLS